MNVFVCRIDDFRLHVVAFGYFRICIACFCLICLLLFFSFPFHHCSLLMFSCCYNSFSHLFSFPPSCTPHRNVRLFFIFSSSAEFPVGQRLLCRHEILPRWQQQPVLPTPLLALAVLSLALLFSFQTFKAFCLA